MNNIKRFSHFAAAGVLALTTAVYMPTYHAEPVNAASCQYGILDNEATTTIDGSTGCYQIPANVTNVNTINITNSNITLDLNSTDLSGATINIDADSTVTIIGSDTAANTIVNAGTLNIGDGSTATAVKSAIQSTGSLTIKAEGVMEGGITGNYTAANGAAFVASEYSDPDEISITADQMVYDDTSNSGNYVVEAKLTAADITVSNFTVAENGGTLDITTPIASDNAAIADVLGFYDVAIELTDTDASDYATVGVDKVTITGVKTAADLATKVTFTYEDNEIEITSAKLTVTSVLGSVDARFTSGGDTTMNAALGNQTMSTSRNIPTLYLDTADDTRAKMTATVYPRISGGSGRYTLSDVEWTVATEDTNIVSVEDTGDQNDVLTITAVGAGKATITATAKTVDGTTKSTTFAVQVYNVLDSLTQKKAIDIVAGDTFAGNFADYFNETGLNATFEATAITNTASESYIEIDTGSVKGTAVTGSNIALVTITATERNTGATVTGTLQVNVLPALETIELADVTNTDAAQPYELDLFAGEEYDVLENITLKDSEGEELEVKSITLNTADNTTIDIDDTNITALAAGAQDVTATITYVDNAGNERQPDDPITIKVTVSDEFDRIEIENNDIELTAGDEETVNVKTYSVNTEIDRFVILQGTNSSVTITTDEDEKTLTVKANDDIEETTVETVEVLAIDTNGTAKATTFKVTVNPAAPVDDNNNDDNNGGNTTPTTPTDDNNNQSDNNTNDNNGNADNGTTTSGEVNGMGIADDEDDEEESSELLVTSSNTTTSPNTGFNTAERVSAKDSSALASTMTAVIAAITGAAAVIFSRKKSTRK